MKQSAIKSKLGLGVAILFLGLILVFGSDSPLRSIKPSTSFASEPVTVTGFTADEVQDGQVPSRILIPDLGIDLEVEKSRAIKGYWEVFEDKAGWGEGSGIPGDVGNQVIFAHAREGLFLPLKEVSYDNKIYVLTKGKWHSYEISKIKEVSPSQTEVIAPTEDETLTLYTCSGFNDSKRLIVVAKPDLPADVNN